MTGNAQSFKEAMDKMEVLFKVIASKRALVESLNVSSTCSAPLAKDITPQLFERISTEVNNVTVRPMINSLAAAAC